MFKNNFSVRFICKIIIRIVKKMSSFVGMHPKFLTLPLTKEKKKKKKKKEKKKKERAKYNPSSKASFLKLLKNCH